MQHEVGNLAQVLIEKKSLYHSSSCHIILFSAGGLALCHLLFFQMKYVVMYGLPRVHAMFDHINAPLPPVCILGMYLFQDFWRYADLMIIKIYSQQMLHLYMGYAQKYIVYLCNIGFKSTF